MSKSINTLRHDRAELVTWDDARGFGFARLPGGTERVFVHVRSFAADMRRPRVGDHLELDVVPGKGGKPAAQNVRIIEADAVASSPLSLHLATAAMLVILLQIALMRGEMPLWGASTYVLMGGLSLFAYSWDKQAAVAGTWRVRERDLLVIDLLGGIIGGLIGQHMLRHKRNKTSFQSRTLLAVVLHAGLLGLVGSGLAF